MAIRQAVWLIHAEFLQEAALGMRIDIMLSTRLVRDQRHLALAMTSAVR